MAQAQYDKFIQLRKEGVDAKTARTQAYGETPTAPTPTGGATLPIAPTVTPATPPVQPTVTGVNGEQFVQAPVDQATGLSAPVQATVQEPKMEVASITTPTTTPQVVNQPLPDTTAPKEGIPKQTPATFTAQDQAKVDAVKAGTATAIDYNQAKGREQDIMNNLNSFKAVNPDPESIKKSAGYYDPNISPEKKAMIDAFVGNIDNSANLDTNSIYNMLATGQVISPAIKSNPYYKQAEATYKKVQNFQTMTPQQLVTSLNTGSLLPGTSEYEQLIKDPVMKGKIEMARAYSSGDIDYGKVQTNKSNEILSQNSKVAQAMEDGIISIDEYNQMTNNPDVVAKAKEVEAKTMEKIQVKKEMNDAIEKLKRDFAGSPFLQGMINDTKTAYQADIDILALEEATLNGSLFDLKATSTALYNANMDNYIAYRNAQIGIDTRRATNALDLEQSQAEFEQGLAQATQATKDPTQRINSVLEQFKTLGIVPTLDLGGHLASFASSGLSLDEYTKKMIENFKAKPEYAQIMAKQANEGVSFQTIGNKVYKVQNGQLIDTGISTPIATTQDWAKLDDTTLYNQKTGEMKKVSASEASAYGPSTADLTPDTIKGLSNRLSGNNVQCGMVSNDYMAVKFPGAKRMGDSYESKVASVESIGVSDVPQVGGVFAMNTYNSNGHTGIVQSVDLANGTFTATDANRSGSQNGGPVTTSTYKISDNFTFSKAPQGVSQSAGMTPEEIQELDALATTSNLDKGYRARQVALQQKFNAVNDKAKKEIPSYNSLNRLLSNEGTQQGTSDNDVRYLREALSDYLKTGNEKVILDSIEARIINAKDKTPLKGIQDYAKLKLYADALNEYAKTGNPNVIKAVQSSLASKFGLPTEQTEYKSFLENGNLNEVLRIAGTSFTDAFIDRLNNIMITPKDTPEAVAQKINGLLKKAELEVSPAKKLIGDDVLNKVYPGAFGSTPVFTGGNSSIPSSTNYNVQSDWDNL